jgi:hypothetical protein
LLAFRLEHERALANRAQHLAGLEMLVGRNIRAREAETSAPATQKEPSPEDD